MFTRFGIFTLCWAVSTTALAEPEVWVEHNRIKLSDVVKNAPARLREIDLGPAPPPGSSKLIPRSEVEDELRSLGENPHAVQLDPVIRVARKSQKRTANEAQEWFQPAIVRALPPGIYLQQIKLHRALVTPVHATLGQVTVPRPPRRVGSTTVTATVEIKDANDVYLRVPVSLVLHVSTEGASAVLSRGNRVEVVIEKGPASISATGIALQDMDLGETGSFKILATHRVIRARLASKTHAQVVDG